MIEEKVNYRELEIINHINNIPLNKIYLQPAHIIKEYFECLEARKQYKTIVDLDLDSLNVNNNVLKVEIAGFHDGLRFTCNLTISNKGVTIDCNN